MSRPGRRAAVRAALVLALALSSAPGGTPAAVAAEPAAGGAAASNPAAVGAAPAARARLVYHGSRADRVVALTFDDGYGPATVRQVFETLLREQVPATFFVTGVYIHQDPALWRAIAAAGYPLANHSNLHRDMTTLAPAEVLHDLARTRQVVEAATGRPMLPAFRPPYGAHTAATDALAAAAGFPAIVLWDVTGGDTMRHPTAASVAAAATAGRPGSIVLLHAGPGVTVRALPAIIASYRARGFRFVTIAELLSLQAGPGTAATPPPPGGPAPSGPAPAGTSPLAGTPPPANPGDARSRSIDRPGDQPPAAAGPIGSGPAGGLSQVARPTAAPAAPPTPGAAPAPPPAGGRPAARDAAPARRADTTMAVAWATVIGLLFLVLVGAALGRGRDAGGEPGG